MARLLWKDPFWDGKRRPFILSVLTAALFLILLFLGDTSYLYGSVYRDSTRIQNLRILAINHDQGAIGTSLETAYSTLRSPSFPTLHFVPSSAYPSVQDARKAVCKGGYWGAIIANPGASERLEVALQGGLSAEEYNSSNTLTYIWNGAHYPTVQQAHIQANLEGLIALTSTTYKTLYGSSTLSTLNTTSIPATQAFLNPITPSNHNIQPTTQGPRIFYNTITIAYSIIAQFFFLMLLNDIFTRFSIFGHLDSFQISLIKILVSLTYTFLSSLAVTGHMWAFRESWAVSAAQFAKTWMVYWLDMHIQFVLLDAAIALIPVSFISVFILVWVEVNVTSTLAPFELSPGFYRWGYALPGYNVVSLLWFVWSGEGCNNHSGRNLGVLFAWDVVVVGAAVASSWRRNVKARQEVLRGKNGEGMNETMEERERPGGEREDEKLLSGGPGYPMPFADFVYKRPELKRQITC